MNEVVCKHPDNELVARLLEYGISVCRETTEFGETLLIRMSDAFLENVSGSYRFCIDALETLGLYTDTDPTHLMCNGQMSNQLSFPVVDGQVIIKTIQGDLKYIDIDLVLLSLNETIVANTDSTLIAAFNYLKHLWKNSIFNYVTVEHLIGVLLYIALFKGIENTDVVKWAIDKDFEGIRED